MLPQTHTLEDFARHVQLAIGPVVLISGVGLLLLTMTNRFGRIIDRGRIVRDLLGRTDGDAHEALRAQLVVLRRQAHLMRLAVSCGATSVLLTAVLILVVFTGPLLGWQPTALAVALFAGALLAVVVAMAFFVREVTMSTAAHDLDLRRMTGELPVPTPIRAARAVPAAHRAR